MATTLIGYDSWLLRGPGGPYDDSGPEPRECGCAGCVANDGEPGEVLPEEDADEDGRYRIWPEVCSACEDAGCDTTRPCLALCRCGAFADACEQLCARCDAFGDASHFQLTGHPHMRRDEMRRLAAAYDAEHGRAS